MLTPESICDPGWRHAATWWPVAMMKAPRRILRSVIGGSVSKGKAQSGRQRGTGAGALVVGILAAGMAGPHRLLGLAGELGEHVLLDARERQADAVARVVQIHRHDAADAAWPR